MRAFLTELYNIWIAERPSQLAAALAYYGMFSFAPVIFIGFTVAGLFIDKLAAAERLYGRLAALLGPETSELVQDSVAAIGHSATGSSVLASLVSFIALFAAASGLFFQVQFSLNRIWRVPPPQKGQTGVFIKQRMFSFVMVLGVGLLLILATVANLALGWFGARLEILFDVSVPSVFMTGLASLGLLTLSFALLYKVLPDLDIAWRDVWVGALAVALLVVLGALLLGVYFKSSTVGSAFEAAGTFAVLLIGIYYVAQIFLFGAVVCRVYAGLFGSQRSVAGNKKLHQ
jgi:membrane protein